VTATHVVWRENRAIPEVPSPLVYENRVYYVRNGGILTCWTRHGWRGLPGRLGAPALLRRRSALAAVCSWPGEGMLMVSYL
jgi:hypothetical protein